MLHRYLLLTFLFLMFLFSGCQEKPKLNQSSNSQLDVDLTKLSTNKLFDQTDSNKAKDHLKQHENIKSIKAVNTDENLLITFEVNHLKRFQLEKIRKDIEQELKNEFSNLDVFVSTDQKIILELEKIEQHIQEQSITKEELNKKVKDLLSLAKEET